MTCAPYSPPAARDFAGLHTCAEIIRDIFLGVRCAANAANARDAADVAVSCNVPSHPHVPCKAA